MWNEESFLVSLIENYDKKTCIFCCHVGKDLIVLLLGYMVLA
jgi:hypothetical protein